ncbi:hypothetical protein ACPOL_5568 [Acidisarcina polymorpha]|uniref:NIPSNAP domain-containing protein n=1 Tax=Acidisarcina polymorpha TaxID=2211140 RepID=A0A2Z5G8E3_9BACT|nr:NIPSNAP family protein [Acidisarcina polymorpha]AXC14816.1 hypothetical protein ACPOL_5568 [Acidisarcina polymorpha]
MVHSSEVIIQRRQFLAASLATSALTLTRKGRAQAAPAASREFYLLRRYELQSGPQTKLTESYFATALIPALMRMKVGPVGAFQLTIGPETPTFYLLVPGNSVESLATLDLHLAQDEQFLKDADPFWAAPATAPSFLRVESTLLAAFEGWPKLTPPATAAKRIFQLRTYESPSDRDHVRKVEMFNQAELDVFRNAGFHPVFYGDALIGPRLPKLTYMLSFPSMEELNARWAVFGADPNWKKLSSSPRYAFEEIVSSITNLILTPLTCSQI